MGGKQKSDTSPAGQCVVFLRGIHPRGATLSQLAEIIHWPAEPTKLGVKLHIRARSQFGPDIEKVGNLWVYRPPHDDLRSGDRFKTPQAWIRPGPVATSRTLPEGTWTPPRTVIRPDGLEYQDIPSLQGGQRVKYRPPACSAGTVNLEVIEDE